MSLAGFSMVVAIALVAALVVGAIAVLVLRLVPRMSLMLQLCVVVLASIVSLLAGMSAVATAMFLSPHDLTVSYTVGAVAGLVSLGMAIVLGRILIRGSRSLTDAARRIGEGELVSSGHNSTTEFGALAAELTETSRKLAEARDRVAAMERSRRELITWISHDLRTPLAGIGAMAEALEDRMVDDPDRYYRQMRTQVNRLAGMVDDLFELSRIHSGDLRLSLEPVSLYDLVSDAVADLAPLARTRTVTLEEPDSRPVVVMADPRELSRVVNNLLMNAIQHTPDGSSIVVSAHELPDGRARVSVTDSGGGIPEEDLPLVFETGWRGNPARTPSQQPLPHSSPQPQNGTGAGLGLAIVRGIVTAHAGEVAVRNVPGGCRFDVVLPRSLELPRQAGVPA